MRDLVTALANGVSLGALYALMALAFVVVVRATGVLNFAQGSFLLLGVYVTAELSPTLGFWAAVPCGLAAAAVIGIATEVLIVRNVSSRDPVTLTILTLGINLLLITEISRRIGHETIPIHDPWGDRLVQIGSGVIPASRVWALIFAVVVIALFLLAFRYTRWGLAMRVSAQDSKVAALMGVRLSRISWSSWAIGGALAAIAGMFLTTFPSAGLTPTLGDVAMTAFPAAVIGGLTSVQGALVGGLGVGVIVALTTTYESAFGPFGEGLSTMVPNILMFIVLLVRPEGIFGSRTVTRV